MKQLLKKGSKEDLLNLLNLLDQFHEIELEDVEMEVGDLEFWLQSSAATAALSKALTTTPISAKTKPESLLDADFTLPIEEYPGQVAEVTLGATKNEGGTRGKKITIGGEKAPAFYLFESSTPNSPVISLDVFDTRIPLAKPVKQHFEAVLEDPVAWGKLVVEQYITK
jgi:acetyl-CoA decarbonylase/synthase complex subunit delta